MSDPAFEQFFEPRRMAAQGYLEGNPEPVDTLVSPASAAA
jgi:hypothetical protein